MNYITVKEMYKILDISKDKFNLLKKYGFFSDIQHRGYCQKYYNEKDAYDFKKLTELDIARIVYKTPDAITNKDLINLLSIKNSTIVRMRAAGHLPNPIPKIPYKCISIYSLNEVMICVKKYNWYYNEKILKELKFIGHKTNNKLVPLK
jgi:hypothetical protein